MKKAAVINDISGCGKCSLTVSLPIISVMGIECCPMPTAVLSNQTGFDSFYCADFTEHLTDYIDVWKRQKLTFDAVLTGYLASEKQADIIIDFIDFFGKDATVFVDPVMADDGVLYDTYNEKLCNKVKKLSEKANILTPNLTELCILCNADYDELSEGHNIEKISNSAKTLLSPVTETVIVTGIKSDDEILNIIVDKNGTSIVKSPLLKGSYSGTGDIFSSIVCGAVTNGKTVTESVKLATDFISKAIKNTPTKFDYEPDGVNFQDCLEMLINA